MDDDTGNQSPAEENKENAASPEAGIPPLQNYTLDLRNLTREEETIIQHVLERDAIELDILDNKLGYIRKEIQEIRHKGVLVAGDHQNTICARCKHKFWLLPLPLTDRGVRCIRCKFRVCAKCRHKQVNNTWLCSLCLKYRQEKFLTGEWMISGPIAGIYGSDLMRASLRDKGRVAEDHYTDIPGSDAGGMQYTQRPALSKGKDADSGSRTSLNSTTPSASTGDSKAVHNKGFGDGDDSESSISNNSRCNRNDGNNQFRGSSDSDDGGGGGGSGGGSGGRGGDGRCNNTYRHRNGRDTTDTDSGVPASDGHGARHHHREAVTPITNQPNRGGNPRPNSLVFGSNNNNFARMPTAERLKRLPNRHKPKKEGGMKSPFPQKKGKRFQDVVLGMSTTPNVKPKGEVGVTTIEEVTKVEVSSPEPETSEKKGGHKKGKGKGKKDKNSDEDDEKGNDSEKEKDSSKDKKKEKGKGKDKKHDKGKEKGSGKDKGKKEGKDKGKDKGKGKGKDKKGKDKKDKNKGKDKKGGASGNSKGKDAKGKGGKGKGDKKKKGKNNNKGSTGHATNTTQNKFEDTKDERADSSDERHVEIAHDILFDMSPQRLGGREFHSQSNVMQNTQNTHGVMKSSKAKVIGDGTIREKYIFTLSESQSSQSMPAGRGEYDCKSFPYKKTHCRDHASPSIHLNHIRSQIPMKRLSDSDLKTLKKATELDSEMRPRKLTRPRSLSNHDNTDSKLTLCKNVEFKPMKTPDPEIKPVSLSRKETAAKGQKHLENDNMTRRIQNGEMNTADVRERHANGKLKSSRKLKARNNRNKYNPIADSFQSSNTPLDHDNAPSSAIVRQLVDFVKNRFSNSKSKSVSPSRRRVNGVKKLRKQIPDGDKVKGKEYKQGTNQAQKSTRRTKTEQISTIPCHVDRDGESKIGSDTLFKETHSFVDRERFVDIKYSKNDVNKPVRDKNIRHRFRDYPKDIHPDAADQTTRVRCMPGDRQTTKHKIHHGREKSSQSGRNVSSKFNNPHSYLPGNIRHELRRLSSDDDTDIHNSISNLSRKGNAKTVDRLQEFQNILSQNEDSLITKCFWENPYCDGQRSLFTNNQSTIGVNDISRCQGDNLLSGDTISRQYKTIISSDKTNRKRRQKSASRRGDECKRMSQRAESPAVIDKLGTFGLPIDFNVNFQPRTMKRAAPVPKRRTTNKEGKASGTTPTRRGHRPSAAHSHNTSKTNNNVGKTTTSRQKRCKVSDLEKFRSRAQKYTGSVSPRILLNSVESVEHEQHQQDEHSLTESTSSTEPQSPEQVFEDDVMEEDEERRFAEHWHETLRRKSVEEENLKKRRQSFGYLDKPLLASSSKNPYFSKIVSLVIPEETGVEKDTSCFLSPGSTSSQDSISSYVKRFMESSNSRDRTSTPSRTPEVVRKANTSAGEQVPVYNAADPLGVRSDSLSIPLGPSAKVVNPRVGNESSRPKRGRKKRRSPETKEDTALVNSTSSISGNAANDNYGSVQASSPGAQRRDSYSKALENQKIRVILPKGNEDDAVDGRQQHDQEHADTSQPRRTLPMHGGKEDVDESDKESINSSLSSHSSIRPISKNASTNSSFSSRSSSKSMHPSDNHRAHQHSDSNSTRPVSGEDDAYSSNKRGADSHYENRSSMHSGGGGDYDRAKPSARSGRDSSSDRKDSFEEIYDSNVNRMLKMMTGGQVSDSDSSSSDAKRSSQRLLPRPPDSGKENNDGGVAYDDCNIGEKLLESRLSLTEELEESLKYLNLTDSKTAGSDDGDVAFSSGDIHDINPKHVVDNDNRVHISGDVKDKNTGSEVTYTDNDKTGSFTKHVTDVPSETDINDEAKYTQEQGDLCISDEDIDEILKDQDDVLISKEHPGFSEETEFENFTLDDQNLMMSYLRTAENDIPYEFKANLSRNDSNASDVLSRITEVSEPCGEADSLNSGEGSDSDDTLDGEEFDESFSDDNEVMNSSKSSVINALEQVAKANEINNDRQNRSVNGKDVSFSVKKDVSDTKDYDEGIRFDKDDEYDDNNDEPNSEASTSAQDDSGIPDTDRSEASTIGSEDSSSTLPGLEDPFKTDLSFSSSVLSEFDLDKDPEDILKLAMTTASTPTPDESVLDTPAAEASAKSNDGDATGPAKKGEGGDGKKGSGKVTLLSMALEQRHKDYQDHPPLRQLKIYKMLSSSISDSSLDLEDKEEVRIRKKRLPMTQSDRDLTKQKTPPTAPVVVSSRLRQEPVVHIKSFGKHNDSVRDSDSGVNSSQTSRANTPDAKSVSSGGDKGGANKNTNASSSSSPSLAKPQPQQQQQLPLAQVPTIAVTEEPTGEEDDDLDELFSQHRPQGGSNLSTRSSLRESRESLYSVYSAAGEEHYGDIPVTGEIMFNLEYNYKTGMLSVHIKQCKELAPVDVKKQRSDPYVKTYLMPDKTRSGKRKTKIKRHTLNPTYNESLHYTISKTELESRSLWISVWNNDRFGRNDFLGEVTVPLDYYEFDKSTPLWYALQDRQQSDDVPAMTYKGDLYISLKYVPASMVSGTMTKKRGSLKRKDKTALKTGLGEVHVLVKEAHDLTAMRSNGGSNPFCKGYLLPDETHHSKQKTPVVKKTTSPSWQHLLVFEGVDETELENHGVELTVWDHETLSSNDFLGGVRLNTGTGYIRGKEVPWMDARGEEIEVWQRMVDRHNEWIDIQLPLRASMGKQKK